MDFSTHGFLCSPDDKARDQLTEFSNELGLALQINEIAMRLIWELVVPPERKDLSLGALLHIRAVRNYQASLILLQQGLPVESQSLCRHIIECVLRMAKLAKDPCFSQRMDAELERHRITQAEKLIDLEQDPELVARYREVAARDRPDGAGNWEELARDVGLEPLYQALYRGASGYAAHATLGALLGDVVRSEEGTNFSFSRKYGSAAEHALSMLIPLGIEVIHQLGILFKLTWTEDEAIRFSLIWQAMCREHSKSPRSGSLGPSAPQSNQATDQ